MFGFCTLFFSISSLPSFWRFSSVCPELRLNQHLVSAACFPVSGCLGGLQLTISSSHKHSERHRLPPFLIRAYFRCPSCCYQGCSAAHVSQSCNQRFFFWPVLPCSRSHTAQKTTPLLHKNFASIPAWNWVELIVRAHLHVLGSVHG